MTTFLLFCLGGCGVLVGVPSGARGENVPQERVQQAIDKGVQYLWSTQRPDGSWPPHGNPPKNGQRTGHYYPGGPTSLACYALLESGVTPMDPRMAKALEFLDKLDTTKTYVVGIRSNVWLAANEFTRGKFLKQIKQDVARLILSTKDGSYNYESQANGKSSGDHSNSQYGVLGVWAGAQADLEIPKAYWTKVYKHWVMTQGADGGWAYGNKGRPAPYKDRPWKDSEGKTHTPPKAPPGNTGHRSATATMSAAGLATLFVCADNLMGAQFLNCNRKNEIKPIKAALDWFDRNFADTMRSPNAYYLYGVERIGLASGYKYFGDRDWYKDGVKILLARQSGNGAWSMGYGGEVSTSYCLLFLLRGRNPVAFNKLEYHGQWNNRPRDLAQLTRWLSKQFERTINWQSINLHVPVSEMHDAPFLYIAGSVAPTFSEEDLQKLRTYVYQGGTILSVSECGTAFDTAMKKVYQELFPRYELTKCGPKHPIYTAYKDLHGQPALSIISNGVRPLVVHTNKDLAKSWMMRASTSNRRDFEVAANLIFYVAGGIGDLRLRGVSHFPAPLENPGSTSKTLKVARLWFAGNCDPEPLAFDRLLRKIRTDDGIELTFAETAKPEEVKTAIKVTDGNPGQGMIAPEELPASGAQVAFLSGQGKFTLSNEARGAIKTWVENGGTLIVDAVGGDRAFAGDAKKLLRTMFGDDAMEPLAVSSQIYLSPGHEVGKIHYRRASRDRLGSANAPRLEVIKVKDRPAVFFSEEDLTAGLVGYESGVVDGYKPEDAYNLVRNILVEVQKTAAAKPAEPKPADEEAKADEAKQE